MPPDPASGRPPEPPDIRCRVTGQRMPKPTSLFAPDERALAAGLAALAHQNPFLPERVERERALLGSDYVEIGPAMAFQPSGIDVGVNTSALLARGERLFAAVQPRFAALAPAPAERELYEGFALFLLYHRWAEALAELVAGEDERAPLRVPWYARFREDCLATLRPGGVELPSRFEPAHVLALFFQVARAFRQVFGNLVGSSPAAIRLRAAVWQSVFTHDIARYQRALHRRMADVATLVTGPSGTGKELVARAVGNSGYLAFDEGTRAFESEPGALLLALNLSALSPQLIESELFGYKKGAFTGALADRAGWFEACPAGGAVFLDEIGECAPEIQVKLLRVLQTRRFQRLGDTRAREFHGRLISATNRDLAAELAAGRFREDLFYRICSDRIETPTLAEQVNGDAAELARLVAFVAGRQAGEEGAALARETMAWIEQTLGLAYAWPGNFRELEQCVRSVLVRKRYEPPARPARAPGEELVARLRALELTAEELLSAYCTLVYAHEQSYDAAARRLGLDRRTVRAKVDPALLARLGG
jgi:DNA-binding NtrC family response regulator